MSLILPYFWKEMCCSDIRDLEQRRIDLNQDVRDTSRMGFSPSQPNSDYVNIFLITVNKT